MKRLAAALLASTAVALQPACGQSVAESVKAAIGPSNFGMYSFGGRIGLGYVDGTGKPKSVPVALEQMPHVADNAAVRRLPATIGRVRREGYATSGDGGAADYDTSATACSLNSGAGDGGSQVGLIGPNGSAGTYVGCAVADFGGAGASLKVWGGLDDDTADNQPIATAALAGLDALGGGRLVIPMPKAGGCFLFKSTLAQTYPNIQIQGQAGGSCVDRGFASGAVIFLGTSGGGGLLNTGALDLTFKHSVAATSGADVQVAGTRNTRVQNITCLKSSFQCVAVDNSVLTEINDIQDSAEGHSAIALGCNYGGTAADITIRGGNINYQHAAAVEECNASGITFNGGLNTDFNQHGLWAHPGPGQSVGANYIVDPFFDQNFAEGVLFDATGGGTIIENVTLPTMWVATCSGSATVPSKNVVTGDSFATPFADSPSLPCFSVKGSLTAKSGAGSVVDNTFFAHVMNSGGDGVALSGGFGNDFGGFSSDSCLGTNAPGHCGGFHVAAGTMNFSWRGRMGGMTGLGRTNNDNYGAIVDPGASDYYTIAGDGSGNNTGALLDGGTGLHKDVSGVLPAPGWGGYTVAASDTSGTPATFGSLAGQYQIRGATCFFTASVTITRAGSGNGAIIVGIPVKSGGVTDTVLPGRENASTGTGLLGIIGAGASTTMTVVTGTNGYAGGAGYRLVVSGSYQIATP